MTRVIAVQLGLPAFGIAVCVGLFAGNSFSTVVTRAPLAMAVIAAIRLVAGWMNKLVLRDHVRERRTRIDRQHHEQRRAAADGPGPEPSASGGGG